MPISTLSIHFSSFLFVSYSCSGVLYVISTSSFILSPIFCLIFLLSHLFVSDRLFIWNTLTMIFYLSGSLCYLFPKFLFPYWIIKFVLNELLFARKYKSLVDFSWEVLLIKSLSREAEGCQVEKLICLDITVVCRYHISS